MKILWESEKYCKDKNDRDYYNSNKKLIKKLGIGKVMSRKVLNICDVEIVE